TSSPQITYLGVGRTARVITRDAHDAPEGRPANGPPVSGKGPVVVSMKLPNRKRWKPAELFGPFVRWTGLLCTRASIYHVHHAFLLSSFQASTLVMTESARCCISSLNAS